MKINTHKEESDRLR